MNMQVGNYHLELLALITELRWVQLIIHCLAISLPISRECIATCACMCLYLSYKVMCNTLYSLSHMYMYMYITQV